MNIQEGGRLDGTKGNKGMGRKANNKGKRYGNGPATTDEQLMARLGEVLGGNMREDFIVVHLQEPCSMCRGHVTGEQHSQQLARTMCTGAGFIGHGAMCAASGTCGCQACYPDADRSHNSAWCWHMLVPAHSKV